MEGDKIHLQPNKNRLLSREAVDRCFQRQQQIYHCRNPSKTTETTVKHHRLLKNSHRAPQRKPLTTKTTNKHHRKPRYTKIDLTLPKNKQNQFLFFFFFSRQRLFQVTKNNSFRGSSRHYPGGLSPHRRCCHREEVDQK